MNFWKVWRIRIHQLKSKNLRNISKNARISLSFLFGSRAYGRERASSDWDIGIYLKEENWEGEHEIRLDIQKIVGAETDLSEDYYRVFERSASLSAGDKNRDCGKNL